MKESLITQLQDGKYSIESLIGSGGFGNTYLATQVALGRKVAIKEFFMKEYCDRDEATSRIIVPTESSRMIVDRYRQKFLKEAQIIASMRNEHIVQIFDIFEENNTAYYVMEYIDGGSLKDKVEKQGPMPESAAVQYICQVGDALTYLHSNNILHLDVKPANILLDQSDKAILIDFGISKHYDSSGGQTSTTPVGISKGYAPIEQYQQGSVSGFAPSTDVYSLGATFYNLLTGETPPEASIVNEDGLPDIINRFSDTVRAALLSAMAPRRKDRFQTVAEFTAALTEPKVVAPVSEPVKEVPQDDVTVIVGQPAPAPNAAAKPSPEQKPKAKKAAPKKEIEPKPAEPVKTPAKKNGSKAGIIVAVVGLVVAAAAGYFIVDEFYINADAKKETVKTVNPQIIFADGTNSKVLSFDSTGNGSKTVEITKNFTENVTISNAPDWVSVVYRNNTVSVQCKANDSSAKEVKVYLHKQGAADQSALAQILIKQAAAPKQEASISHKSATLDLGKTLQLSAKDAQGAVDWNSSNSAVATVSSTGLVKSKASGNATIQAKVDGQVLTCTVKVPVKENTQQTQPKETKSTQTKVTETKVTETKSSQTSQTSAGTTSTQTIQTTKGSSKTDQHLKLNSKVTLTVNQTVTKWQSENEQIASVNANGVVTAKAVGKTKVWAQLKNGAMKMFVITVE